MFRKYYCVKENLLSTLIADSNVEGSANASKAFGAHRNAVFDSSTYPLWRRDKHIVLGTI